VVDGHVGFGAKRCVPAGPLREPIETGLSRAQAVVLMGEDRAGVIALFGDKPILRARLEPEADAGTLAGQRVLAFAGIGRPGKFFQTLQALGVELIDTRAFADHHPYTRAEIDRLAASAAAQEARLVTTAKDFVRLPPDRRDEVEVLRIAVVWDDEAALARILAPIAGAPR
jgi:tetraacyldisaccharide 4'-kinase